MALSQKIGVRELAKELGLRDRDLLDMASKVNIRPTLNQFEGAQAAVLRTRFRNVAAVPAAAPVIVVAQAPQITRFASAASRATQAATPVEPPKQMPSVVRRRTTASEDQEAQAAADEKAAADATAATTGRSDLEPKAGTEPRTRDLKATVSAHEIADTTSEPAEPGAGDAGPTPATAADQGHEASGPAAQVRTDIAVAPADAPVAVTAEPTRLPRGPDNSPKIKRIKASDLDVPPELQLRVYDTPAKVAAPTSMEADVSLASTASVEDDAAATASDKLASEAAGTKPGASGSAAQRHESASSLRAIARATAEAAAKKQAVVVPEPVVAIKPGMRLEDIGKAIESGAASPSSARKPTLRRIAMPDALANLPPKPAPKPVVPEAVKPPAAPGAPNEFGARVGREAEPAAPAGDVRGARGRKLIYDRHRDAQSLGGVDARGRAKKKGGKGGKAIPIAAVAAAPTKAEKRHLRIEDTITVANLAHQMSVKANEVIKKLFSLGMMATVNHPLDLDTVELIAGDFGFTVENVGFDLEQYLQKPVEVLGVETPRSPVVTVMGHVDHGKTSLLDAIRKTHTAAKEAGGITQHIGAYVAEVPGDHFDDGKERRVVFLDTPGHEAFSAMRARGAKATDVVVLVVAADDGVMPQTIEAINHAKAAKVPIVVAVNKIDKPGADIDKVRRELADQGVVAEEWGGDTIFVEVSAKTGKNIDKMLEMLALQADLLELKANAECDARGLVIESRLERGRGPVATLLVQAGTLRKGQYIVAGSQYCRVRAMMSDLGKPVEIAGPSTPVEVIGFDHVTVAGDEFYIVADEKKAKAIVEHRIEKGREREALKTSKRTIEDMFGPVGDVQQKELNLIVKADVHGSAEALKQALSKIEHEEVKVRVLHAAVGGVTEGDINLGATTKGVVIAFNVKPEAKGKRLADELGVQIRQYSVIYDAIDDVTSMLEGMLTPIIEEVVLGHAEIRQVFSVPKLGVIAGSNVTDGVLQRNQRLRVLRGKDVVHDGEFASLRRFKDDVKEVAQGYDCGIGITGFTKFVVGDIVQCYELKKIPRKLKADPADRRGQSAAPA